MGINSKGVKHCFIKHLLLFDLQTGGGVERGQLSSNNGD